MANEAQRLLLKLTIQNPYSTDPAKGDDFIGRADLVNRLAAKLLRTPMEPFYITGQKRVGKTSLALAVNDLATKKDPTGKRLVRSYIMTFYPPF